MWLYITSRLALSRILFEYLYFYMIAMFLRVYPHRTSEKFVLDRGGNRTRDLWFASPTFGFLVRPLVCYYITPETRIQDHENILIYRRNQISSEIWRTRTDLTSVLPFSKSKFLIFVIKIYLNSLDCIRYFLENSLKFH
jgi:hypothetical protein